VIHVKGNDNWGRIADIKTLDASSLAPGVIKRNVFWVENGWDDYCARHFILPEGQSIAPHSHEWNHLVLSLGGRGEAEVEGETWALDAGNWAIVPSGATHSFRNVGEGDFAFICIVPTHADPHAKKYKKRADGSPENLPKGNIC